MNWKAEIKRFEKTEKFNELLLNYKKRDIIDNWKFNKLNEYENTIIELNQKIEQQEILIDELQEKKCNIANYVNCLPDSKIKKDLEVLIHGKIQEGLDNE